MHINSLKKVIKTAAWGAAVLLLGVGTADAQSVSLTAAPATAALPDGSGVPMWGYTCGAVSGSAKCAPLNPLAASSAGIWSPVVITVTGSNPSLSVTLNDNLTFQGGTVNIPTSLVIVGQLGGGLGTDRKTTSSPLHDNQGATWPIANGAVFTPPAQGPRVQSFATEATPSASATLTFSNLKPGTYLLESGTHPSIQASMGLVGMLVVKNGSGTEYATAANSNTKYAADVPLLFSEIDPVQNRAVDVAVKAPGFSESATISQNLSGPVTSIAITNGGSGYTAPPDVTIVTPNGSTQASATAVVDTDSSSPTFGQVTEIDIATGGSYSVAPQVMISGGGGTGATAVAALQANPTNGAYCSGGAGACYPPVVNYTPLYYLINGLAFDKTNASHSLFSAVTPTPFGNVLVRMVNAGSRMHVPSIVGSTVNTPAVGGFSLIAEDGNPLPGVPRVQSEVFMAAGKTYDVLINTTPPGATALPIFDRELSLSGNAIGRDSGMLAYIGINGSTVPALPSVNTHAVAVNDPYAALIAGQTLTISDPGKGVIANDTNVYGVTLLAPTMNGAVTLNSDGTFIYVPNGSATSDSFTYCANGSVSGTTCSSGITATVTLSRSALADDAITLCPGTSCSFNSNSARAYSVKGPGLLTGATEGSNLTLTVDTTAGPPVLMQGTTAVAGTVTLDANGGFSVSLPNPCADANGCTYTFSFSAKNPVGKSSQPATAQITFPAGNKMVVNVLDGADRKTSIDDYRWILEEDRTFFVDPKCTTPDAQTNKLPDTCLTMANGAAPNFGTNFHSSHMPVIATGCTGTVSCGSGQTVLGQPASTKPLSKPEDIAMCTALPSGVTGIACLDPNKRYYISVLPGDAAQPFISGYAGAPDCSLSGVAAGSCGHGMGGAPIAKLAPGALNYSSTAINVWTEPSPYPPATLSVFVFEDDYPLNGEHDAGGGVDVLSPQEPGLGGFQITLQDDAGGTGDATGTPTYDMFNMPLSNSLAGTIDPVSKLDACPIAAQASNHTTVNGKPVDTASGQAGIVGMIVTCPTYESDGKTLSPLAGQALVKNLYQGRYGVVANPGADRIARGEEWVQTNTLDGQKAHDSFMRIGEPGYFQEFGPAGYHVTIGFASPKVINARYNALCPADPKTAGQSTNADCKYWVKGHITTARMSRTPDERLYGSETHDSYAFTQCYVSLGDPDGAELAFTKCDAQGNFKFNNVPPGNWKITTFDQWNDQVVDGITTPVGLCGAFITDPVTGNVTHGACDNKDMGEVAVHQWQSNIYTRTFIDMNYTGVSQDPGDPGLAFVPTNVRFRDGSYSNFNNTDLNGYAGFNEVFPLFNWYVVETDSTRYKNTGTHVVYDSGGPVDNSAACGANGNKKCGQSQIADHLANTYEPNPLPADLSIPGSVYCDDQDADCSTIPAGIAGGPVPSSTSKTTTGRIDAAWVNSYGWQGYSGQNNFLEFGKRPFAPGETGGIHGHVVYSSTRPFDDPRLLLQLSWEPLIPNVKLNLYQEGLAGDGVTPTLTLVDTTETTSFDAWAQGFRSDGVPNMNCPGQGADGATTDTSGSMLDPYFFFALKDQPQYLDVYNNGSAAKTMPHHSQFKCYDGMHNWNQLQPTPYDGMYSFPSVTGINLGDGKPAGTNCHMYTKTEPWGCVANPTRTDVAPTDPAYDPYRSGQPMLAPGKYVVEVVVPDGFELVKEEDKNILIGDNYIAPVTQQFGGLASIFILPDQASLSSTYNNGNAQNSSTDLGRTTFPSTEADTGSLEQFWPCVGAPHTVPDFISLFPGSQEVSPFAGATRNLCDRKEVTLNEQQSALAKFYLFTETHAAAHFTGVITDDFMAEFDPFSPQFGEKYGPAYLPVDFKDWAGNDVQRVYADAWGAYNGLSYSTWEVNPPNPTGYGPTMLVGCMNDAGPISDGAGGTMTDPLFQDGYSQFCYELPFMPGQTGYFDTPVVPTASFAGDYNVPDCAYPDLTPAVSEVDGDGIGPWVGVAGNQVATLTLVNSGNGYTSLPTLTIAPPVAGQTANAATGKVNDLKLVSISLNNNGNTNYTSAPTVTITGGGGSGATASANINSTTKKVTSFTITSGGHGYTSRPTITVTGGHPATGQSRDATATAVMGVDSISLTAFGTNYASAPAVTFSGNGGASASTTLGAGSTRQLTINALGNLTVDNYQYTGPSQTTAPFNQPKITRRYGFGTQCTTPTVGDATCNTASSVTIGGVAATITLWNDTQIKVNVPFNVPACPVQQQAIYGGSYAACGELVITAGNGKQSVDAVTVTVGGKAPKHITDSTPLTASSFGAIQNAIDAAQPGDLLIVDPAANYKPSNHSEMILMWQPLRLQGVGAPLSVIDANTQPAGKMNPWRQRVVCLFGLALNGTPINGTNPYNSDPAGVSCPDSMNFSVDRLPLEATVGWDATLNGNLAEQLIEPTLMGAYEGAGITVLSKGVNVDKSHAFDSDTFPAGTLLLTTLDCLDGSGKANPYPSNFMCNPSSIDGISIKNSSQGGGAIYVHGWGHNLQIANNRITNNQGTMSGGITVGQGEHPDAYLVGGTATTVPGSCILDPGRASTNLALPYCFDMNVNVHNNFVSQNSSLGDELFSSTPAGAGGVTFCNGSDYYKFNYNWVCGNMSTGDGAGVAHIGLTYHGDIEHNTILFNQSTNPTIVTNGGGLLIMGAPDQDPPCNTPPGQPANDNDCVSPAATISPSDGTGPGLVINANLIVGNSADSGSGGGLRLQHINGTDVLNFHIGNRSPNWPTIPGHEGDIWPSFQANTPWNAVLVTNNIVANNVAGWDGGGVSLQDALATDVVNNTFIANNSTASSGTLFQTLFAPLASTQGVSCSKAGNAQAQNGYSCPQPAGLVSVTNSAVLSQNIGGASLTCPTGHSNTCKLYSNPILDNNVFWHNRALMIGVGSLGSSATNNNQQNVISVFNPGFLDTQGNLTPTQAGSQTATGGCDASGDSYWDIGVRGDNSPGNHSGGTLTTSYSLFTNATLEGTANANNVTGDPSLVSTYCNGSRVPPEAPVPGNGPYAGWQVPAGTNESNGLPAPAYTLAASATVDEGNNWVNLRWGPLSINLPKQTTLNASPSSQTSPVVGKIPSSAGGSTGAYTLAPDMDFFGLARKSDAKVDIGAVEFNTASVPQTFTATVAPASLNFGTWPRNTTSSALTVTITNTGTGALAGGTFTFNTNSRFSRATALQGGAGNCPASGNAGLAVGASCTINLVFSPNAASTTPVTGTLTIAFTGTNPAATVTPNVVNLSGIGANLALDPNTWNPAAPRGCGLLTCQTQVFTLTNGGTTTVTGVGLPSLSGASEFTINTGLSTCGRITLLGGNRTQLTAGQSCIITVTFAPPAGDTTGTRSSTLSITAGGTPITAALTGTVN